MNKQSYPPERIDDVYRVVMRVEEKLDTKVRHLDSRNEARHLENEQRIGKLESLFERMTETVEKLSDRLVGAIERAARQTMSDADQTSKIADLRTELVMLNSGSEARIREAVRAEMSEEADRAAGKAARAWGLGGAGLATAASAVAAYLPEILKAIFG